MQIVHSLVRVCYSYADTNIHTYIQFDEYNAYRLHTYIHTYIHMPGSNVM